MKRVVGPRGRLSVHLCGLAIIAGWAAYALAQHEGPDTEPAEALRYMRVEVPVDAPHTWPRFGYEYEKLPRKISDFERLLDSANSAQRKLVPTEPRIAAVHLEAKLQDNSLVGAGAFDIQYEGDRPAALSLDGCRIALEETQWEDSSPAPIGLDSNRELVAVVEKSGRLSFDWSLEGKFDSSGAMRFEIALPSAARASLTLNAPNEYEVIVSNALLESDEQDSRSGRSHRIELGGHGKTRILMVPATVVESPSGQAFVEQFNHYKLDTQGFSLQTRQDFRVMEKAFTHTTIDIEVDEGLHPTEVKLDGREVAWTFGQGGRTLQIHLEQPLSPFSRHQFELQGVGAFPLGEARKLPSFRTLDAQWLSTRAQVDLAPGLRLEMLDIAGGELEELGELGESGAGVRAVCTFDEPRGHIRLAAAKQQPRLDAERVLAWKVSESEARGNLNAKLTSSNGEIHQVNIAVGPHWEFSESDIHVSAQSTGSEEQPQPVKHRLWPPTVQGGFDGQMATLSFDPPLNPGQTYSVQIAARREHPLPPRSFPLQQLMFAEFPAADWRETIAAVGAVTPISVQLRRGDSQLKSVSARELDEPTTQWLGATSPALVVKSTETVGDARLFISRRAPRVKTHIESRVVIRPNAVDESYAVRCIPDSAGITSLQITMSPPRETALDWEFPPEIVDEGVEVRRLPVAERADMGPAPELWEINFKRGQASPFEFTAQRVSAVSLAEGAPLSLMSTVGGVTQQGRVSVAAERRLGLSLNTHNVESLAPSVAERSSDSNEVVWGAYRYSPTPAITALDARIEVASDDGSPGHAFAWAMLLESKLGNGDFAVHRAAWLVDNQGARSVQIRMQDDCRVQSITVNGKQARHDATDSLQTVDLGGHGPLVRLELEFITPTTSWGFGDRVAPPLPQLNIPVLQRRWRIAPPRGYRFQHHPALATQRRATDDPLRLLCAAIRPVRFLAQESRTDAVWHSPEQESSVRALLEDLNDRLRETGATWGQALLGTQLLTDANSPQLPLLLLDESALSSAGIQPDSQVTHPPLRETTSLGDILDHWNLALVVGPRYAVLTERDFVTVNRGQLRKAPEAAVWVVDGDILTSTFTETASLARRFATPQVWASALMQEQIVAVDSAWPIERTVDASEGVVELAIGENGTTVVFYHLYTVVATAVALLLIAAGGVLCLQRLPLRWSAIGALLAAGATLLFDEPWRLLSSGVFCGITLGLMFGLLTRRSGARQPNRRSERRASVGGAAVRAICVLMAAMVALGGSASTLAENGDKATIYPVWFPVDKEGRSTGYVHLPAPFATKLEARAKANSQPGRTWLIDRAAYRLRLDWRLADERLEVESLEIDLDVLVLDDVTEIAIPLPRGGLALLDNWARLNDESIQPTWRLRESALHIPIEGRGRQHLQLRVRPAATSTGTQTSFQVAIPPVPQAHLTVTAPSEAPEIQVNECVGRIAVDQPENADRRVVEAALGPVESLNVSWLGERKQRADVAEFDLRELVWLKLDPEQPTIAMKFRGVLRRGEPSHIRLEADRSLSPIPADVRLVEGSGTSVPSVDTYRVPVRLAPDGKTFEADVAFRLPEIPPPGRYVLPYIRPIDTASRQRWLAVSTSDAEAAAGAGLDAVDPSSFLERWSEDEPAAENHPQRVFQCDLEQPANVLTLSRPARLPHVQQTLACVYSRGGVAINYEARVDPAGATVHHHVFTIPEKLQISDIAALPVSDSSDSASSPGSAENHVAWWAVRGDRMQVFFKSLPGTPYRLTVTGSMPLPVGVRHAVPSIVCEGVNTLSKRLNVRRKPDVLLTVVRHPGFEPLPHDPTLTEAKVRTVAAMQSESNGQSAADSVCILEARPNRPVASGTQVTKLVRADSVWNLHMDVSLQVRSGKVDFLEFELPTAIAESTTVEGYPFEITPTLDETRSRLTISPREAIGSTVHVVVRATNVIAPGEEVRVPNVPPIGDFLLERYVVVPASFESRNIAWETDGLQPVGDAPLEEELLHDVVDVRTFRVVADTYQARLRSLMEVAGVPLVRLADIHFAWDASGNCLGRAVFDFEPAGMTSCIIEVPRDMQLSHIRVDGMPAQVEKRSSHRWNVRLQSAKLPQRIETIYTGKLDVSGSLPVVEATAPALADIAVERTLWTMYAPPWAGKPELAGAELSAAQQDLIRLRSLADLIRLPRHLRLEYSSSQTRDWLVPWQSRWEHQRRALRRRQLVCAAVAPSSTPDLPLQDADFNYRQSISELEIPNDDAAAPLPEILFTDVLWDRIVADESVAARRMVKGTSRQIHARFVHPQAPGIPWVRYAAAAVCIGGAALAWASPRWVTASDWPLRCGHALGLAAALPIGIAVWPTGVLWLVGIAAVLFFVRAWRTPPAGSVIIVRSSRWDTA